MAKRLRITRENAEALAVQAFTFIAGDPERLGRFLALSGVGPDSIRAAAQDPGFLAGVLDHVAGDEGLLIDFAADIGIEPMEIERARAALGGRAWERDVP
jgi:hypothetical protein